MPLGIAVISGKGGTGKTLVALNLAYELARSGVKTAILDADISNPNLFTLLGIRETPPPNFTPDHRVIPQKIQVDNVELSAFSIESIAGDRGIGKVGEQYAGIVRELIKFAEWDADYLVVDAPAGYYDIHKQIIASFDTAYLGSLLVAQPAHPKDLIRVLDLHVINDIPVAGIIENMSYFTCSCGEKHLIFGQSVTQQIAEANNVPFFGSVPLTTEIRKRLESGMPAIIEGEELRQPFKRAVDHITSLKPRRPGFLERVQEAVSESLKATLFKTVASILLLAKRTVPVRDIKQQFGFPGGRVIHLRLTDRNFENVLAEFFLTLKDDGLKVLEKSATPDVSIVMYYKALAWGLLKRKPTEYGEVAYDFVTALLNDDVRIYGHSNNWENMRSWYVLQAVLERLRQYAPQELESLLRVIA